MKHLNAIVLLCLLAAGLNAQNDTTFIATKTENGVMEPLAIQNRYAELFGTMQPMRWTFKWNPITRSRFDLLNAGAELKLTPAWSLNLTYDPQLGFVSYSDDFFVSDYLLQHTLRTELRYYYDMKRRMNAGRSANNISGNYIGLEALTAIQQTDDINFINAQGLALRFGLQRRFMRRFFFDLSAGLGWQANRYNSERLTFNPNLSEWTHRAYFSPSLTGGMLFGNIPQKGAVSSNCDVLRCFEEEKDLLKVDVTGVLSLFVPVAINTGLGLEYERKIGRSPTSLAIGGGGGYNGFSQQEGSDFKGYQLGVRGEFRYYYSQKKRIASGKSGNNLNGTYLAINSGFNVSKNEYTIRSTTTEIQRVEREQFFTGLLYGVQQRVFKHGFIDLGIGIANSKIVEKNIDTDQLYTNGWEFGIGGRIRAGFAF